MAREPGSRIGKYAVEQAITTRGNTEVYLARDVVLDEPVVIKVLPAKHDPEHPARLQQEAKLLNHVRGSHVVQLRDFNHQPPYLVMEYLEGLSLHELISPKVDPETRWRWTLQMADAVAHVHRYDVVHRDIKPGNLMLNREGSLCLIDFDAALHLVVSAKERLTTVGSQAPHTPPYQAPENPRLADRRYDVFSTGVVIAEIWLGQHPWLRDGMNPEDHNDNIDNPELWWPALDAIDPKLAAVIRKATERDRQRRYQDGLKLRDALQACREQSRVLQVDARSDTPPDGATGSSAQVFKPATAMPTKEEPTVQPNAEPPHSASEAVTVRFLPPSPSTSPAVDAASPPQAEPPESGTAPATEEPAVLPATVSPAPGPLMDVPQLEPEPDPPAMEPPTEESPVRAEPRTPPPEPPTISTPPRPPSPVPQAEIVVGTPEPKQSRAPLVVGILATAIGAIGMLAWRTWPESRPEPPVVVELTHTHEPPPAPRKIVPLDNPFIQIPLPENPVRLGVGARSGKDDPPSRAFEPRARIMSPTTPYEMQQHEVTRSEFGSWCQKQHSVGCADTLLELLTDDPHDDYDPNHRPVHNIPRPIAQRYCEELVKDDPSNTDGRLIGALPSEEEWEWAARGNPDGTLRPHPWGSAPLDPTQTRALLWLSSNPADTFESIDRELAVVMKSEQDKTPGTGLSDLAGNAMEWTSGDVRLASPNKPGDVQVPLAMCDSSPQVRPAPVRGLPLLLIQLHSAAREELKDKPPSASATWRHMRWDGVTPATPCRSPEDPNLARPVPYFTGRLEGVGFRCVKREP